MGGKHKPYRLQGVITLLCGYESLHNQFKARDLMYCIQLKLFLSHFIGNLLIYHNSTANNTLLLNIHTSIMKAVV